MEPCIACSPGGARTSMKPKVGHIVAGRPSDSDERVWAFLCHYMSVTQGGPPAVRDIQKGAGLSSTSVVQAALRKLERQGRIRLGQYGRARAIQIVGARYVLPAEMEPRP